MVYCDRGYGHPSGRARVSHPATYCSSTPRIRFPAVARWHAHLYGLATQNHERSGPHGQEDYLQETDQEKRAVVSGDGHGEGA